MKSVMLSIMFVAVAMISNEVKAQAKMDFKKRGGLIKDSDN
jgi:hypothetical protein